MMITEAELYDTYLDPLITFAGSISREEPSELALATLERAMINMQLFAVLPGHKRLSWLFSAMKSILSEREACNSIPKTPRLMNLMSF